MSNNEAPERIYLTADSVHKSIPEWAAEGEGIEYIRAGLIHKGMKQRIAELEAYNAAWDDRYHEQRDEFLECNKKLTDMIAYSQQLEAERDALKAKVEKLEGKGFKDWGRVS